MKSEESLQIYTDIFNTIRSVIRGDDSVIRKILAVFFSGGHVLLDDYPGTGKTTLAKTIAKSIAADFKRVQFTPDLLPSDILGVSIYDPRDNQFHFHNGPIFTNILLTDEINRASPRTQSALLEAMAENQVSIDGSQYDLGDLFFVIATQNPAESHGTYPLPESQMDRFTMQLRMGYVDRDEEVSILSDGFDPPLEHVKPVASARDIKEVRRFIQQVRISEEMKYYIVDLVASSRTAPGVVLGASVRASLALMKTAQALAFFDNTEFVTPDHVQEIAADVIAHRMALDPQASFGGLTPHLVVHDILKSLRAPS